MKNKKYLLLLLIIPAVLLLNGCWGGPSAEEKTFTPTESQEMEMKKEAEKMEKVEKPEEESIETGVEDITEYESSDELLKDIDSAMDDLDNI